MTANGTVIRLMPGPQAELPLEGLYLDPALAPSPAIHRPFVYTNFISSLDGRIAVEDPGKDGHSVPEMITNPRDWRLYQELAARADALVVSARFIRELAVGKAQDMLPLSNAPPYSDLHRWRREQGLAAQPAVVILSRTLDIPMTDLCQVMDREVYVAVGATADRTGTRAVEATGARVLVAGEGIDVEGKALVEALQAEGFGSIYSIAGPEVLETLLRGEVLDRLYLTHFHRLLGGRVYDTMLEGRSLEPAVSFTVRALYYNARVEDDAGQFFAIYDVV